MRRLLFALTAWLCLAWAGSAFAQSAPTTIYKNNTNAQGSAWPVTGDCAAGSVAVATIQNNGSRSITSIVDSGSNTWSGASNAALGVNNIRIFASLLTSSLTVGGSSTTTVTLSGTANPSVIIECYSSGSATDTFNANVGAASVTSLSYTTATATNAAQMHMALFLSTAWPSASPDPPTGWTFADSIMSGVNFGVKIYYKNVSAGNSAASGTVTFTTATWQAASAAVTTSAAASTPRMPLLGVGN